MATLEHTWKEFCKLGLDFRIEGGRDYQQGNAPLEIRLQMFGLVYPRTYELVGKEGDIKMLLKQATEDGRAHIEARRRLLEGREKGSIRKEE